MFIDAHIKDREPSFDEIAFYIMSSMAQIDAAQAAVEAAQKHLQSCYEQFAELLASFRDHSDEEAMRDLASQLYWQTDIPVSAIAGMLGIQEAGMLCTVIDPWPTGQRCDGCGKMLTWTSRNQRDNKIQWTKCLDCRSAEQEANSHAYQERVAERQRVLERLRSMPYREYLQTVHWDEVRKTALKRAKYRCQMCNQQGALDVHHRTYEGRGEELAADVIVLCRNCHTIFHDQGKLR